MAAEQHSLRLLWTKLYFFYFGLLLFLFQVCAAHFPTTEVTVNQNSIIHSNMSLYTEYTVYTVYAVYPVYTVYAVNTVYTLYAVYTVYTV